jgi:hypothetical protein
VFDWLTENKTLLAWLGGVSGVMFVATLLAVPWLVARIPADYFTRHHAHQPLQRRHPLVAAILRISRNLLGVVFIVAGIAMLVLPGQGILTILLGLMLVEFPGKRRFEFALIRRPTVLKAVNWMRRRAGREELEVQ